MIDARLLQFDRSRTLSLVRYFLDTTDCLPIAPSADEDIWSAGDFETFKMFEHRPNPRVIFLQLVYTHLRGLLYTLTNSIVVNHGSSGPSSGACGALESDEEAAWRCLVEGVGEMVDDPSVGPAAAAIGSHEFTRQMFEDRHLLVRVFYIIHVGTAAERSFNQSSESLCRPATPA